MGVYLESKNYYIPPIIRKYITNYPLPKYNVIVAIYVSNSCYNK